MTVPKLTPYFSEEAIKLLEASGIEVVRRIGLDAVRSVILDVMSGKNIRDSTESLTRRRIAYLNLAIMQFFIQGESEIEGFAAKLPYIAAENLKLKGLSKAEKWLNNWALGLTDKAVQNVLRDSVDSIDSYRDEYIATCANVIADYEALFPKMSGEVSVSPELKAEVTWLWLVYMTNMVGSQTLTIRGSDKSLNGKLFEKLVLGSLLHVLGFSYQPEQALSRFEKVYWLSSRGDRRESDATLLLRPGQAMRFDIGFIGRGNPEISLDKVSRFMREFEKAGEHFYSSTIIIVDRIGDRSGIVELAHEIGGHIVQMSEGYWPQKVARLLGREFDYDSPLADLAQNEVRSFISEKLLSAPLNTFLSLEAADNS